MLPLFLLACAAPHHGGESAGALDSTTTTATTPDHYLLAGGNVVGVGPSDIEIAAGMIVSVLPAGTGPADLARVDVAGSWVAPGFIDSHVHLAYLPDAESLRAGGIAAVVDLAAPVGWLDDPLPMPSRRAGPMITALGGYPTQGWGYAGYGLEVADVSAAEAAVDQLVDAGATVIKVPVGDEPALSAAQLAAVVARAHARGVKVVAHALSDAAVQAAAVAGVDVLAHTPPGALSESTLEMWRGRAVITTLSAFGGRTTLAALRAHDVTVLYGTDFGNTRAAGISATEIGDLLAAGLSPAEIQAAGTTTPAAYWGFSTLGSVAPGQEARLVVLDADPTVDATAWGRVVRSL